MLIVIGPFLTKYIKYSLIDIFKIDGILIPFSRTHELGFDGL